MSDTPNDDHRGLSWRSAQAAPVLLALLTLWLLLGGRWASYLGNPKKSIFVSDVTIAVACLLALFALRHPRRLFAGFRTTWLLPATALLLVWAVLRLAVLPTHAADGVPLRVDPTPATDGNSWVGRFGADGYVLAAWYGSSDLNRLRIATLTLVNGGRYTWASPTGDGRALESADQSSRRAATWFSHDDLTLQLHFQRAYHGTLHLYALDAESAHRRQVVTVTGPHHTTKKILQKSFNNGAWLSFPVRASAGETFTITARAGRNQTAVLSGLFLGGRGKPPRSAVGVQGNWVGYYGGDGYTLAGWSGASDLSLMRKASVTLVQGGRYVWSKGTNEVRALQSAEQTDRRAAAWTDPSRIRLTVHFRAAYAGVIHLYATDWDSSSRRETITVTDDVGSQTQPVSGIFDQGAWRHFPIRVAAGHDVHITVTRTAGANAVLSGALLGGSNPPPLPRYALTMHDALRDFAPYGYAVVALVVGLIVLPFRRVWGALGLGALAAHTAWVAVDIYRPDALPHPLWGGSAHLFEIRGDFDPMVCGLAIAVAIRVLLQRRGLLTSAVAVGLGAVNGWLIIGMTNRAGLIAAAVACTVALLTPSAALDRLPGRLRAPTAVAAVALVIVGGVGAYFFTPAGHRLASYVTGQSNDAAGTAVARSAAYHDVLTYSQRSGSRLAMGVGFGPDFLGASGARQPLSGSDATLRAPHDFTLNTLARLGLVGTLLSIVLTLLGFAAGIRLLRRARSAFDDLAALVLFAMPVVAAFGVVLESPFGAIPYFFAVGYAAYRLRRPAAVDDTAPTTPTDYRQPNAKHPVRSAAEA